MDRELKLYRKRPLIELDALPTNFSALAATLPATLPARLLPHRGPMLLVDRLEGVDLELGHAHGTRFIAPDHVGLEGHFPGYPVLPGALQIEMLGQLGLCLYRFIERASLDTEAPFGDFNIRATKILGAHFLGEIRPGDQVTMLARRLESDEFLGTSICQALVGDQICSVMIGEVYFL